MWKIFWDKCKAVWSRFRDGAKKITVRIWEKLNHPNPVWLAVLYVSTALVCAFAIVAAVLTVKLQKTWFSVLGYVSYGLAAVLFAYTVYTLVKILPKRYQALKERLRNHRVIGSLMKNYGLRTVIFATASTAITLAFAVYHGVIAYLYHSVWFGALAAYYILLLIMRGGIVLYHGKTRGKEKKKEVQIRKYCHCGIGLMITISALSATIWEMVQNSAATRRAGLMIYVVATYTFYKIVMSILNFIKSKKQTDYTVDALRNVNVADAAVSLLALQASMLQEFSDTGMPAANILTGAGVCLLVFGLGLYMVIRSRYFTKKLKEETAGECEDGK